MSGSVHPNPGPILSCSMCAENVTWRRKSVQCCTCSEWVQLRCSQLSLSKFRALGNSHFWSCHPMPQHCDSLLRHVYLHCKTWAPSANAAILPQPRLQTSYPPSAHFIPSHSAPSTLSLTPVPPLLPLTLSGFFSGMMEIFEPGALNYFTFSRPILSTSSTSRNPISTYLTFSDFLDSLLCDLIAPTPGLAFSLLMLPTLAASSSFSSGRVYLSLNFLPHLFHHLIPILIM